MTHDRRPAVATILAMSALVLEKAADDLAAGQLDPERAASLAGTLTGVARLIREHGRRAKAGHPTVCPRLIRARSNQ